MLHSVARRALLFLGSLWATVAWADPALTITSDKSGAVYQPGDKIVWTVKVTGASQGGLQSFVTAGLDPKITAMLVLVPAGCDDTGKLVGRQPGWPYWMSHSTPANEKQVQETSRYFDAVNFAARVKCPVLVGLGLIDVTSPPSGVYTAVNQVKGPKEVVVLPNSEHQGHNNSQAPYFARSSAWLAALRTGAAPPVQP